MVPAPRFAADYGWAGRWPPGRIGGGVYNFQPALGAGGLAITDSFEWTGGPFAQGDVLFFHSMMPHRGVPNTGEQLRLSIDARYQRVADPIAPGSLLPHSQPNTWEAIYADWPDDHLQYYWREHEMDVVDYDNSYHEERDRQALELGEQGDPLAVSALQRIIAPRQRSRQAPAGCRTARGHGGEIALYLGKFFKKDRKSRRP